MNEYRKKPVVIEAMQFKDDAKTLEELSDFIGRELKVNYNNPSKPKLLIETIEGTMTAQVNDFIIKGVQGEFYPCKPDIFEQTYEKT